jgi:hypothetical protein
MHGHAESRCMFRVLLQKPGGMPTASFRGHDLTWPRGACPREQRRGHATLHMDVGTLNTYEARGRAIRAIGAVPRDRRITESGNIRWSEAF